MIFLEIINKFYIFLGECFHTKIKFKKILTSAPIPVEKNNTFVFIRVRKIDAKNADILENTDANNKYGIYVQPM